MKHDPAGGGAALWRLYTETRWQLLSTLKWCQSRML